MYDVNLNMNLNYLPMRREAGRSFYIYIFKKN